MNGPPKSTAALANACNEAASLLGGNGAIIC